MTKHSTVVLVIALSVAAISLWQGLQPHTPAKNPDPNHTHADFAVWINGTEYDFSKLQYMSGSSADEKHEHARDKYLHLHDANGNVIHRHKPGLILGQFFASIGIGFSDNNCIVDSSVSKLPTMRCSKNKFRMFVNGSEMSKFDMSYVFNDGDKILITDAMDPAELSHELGTMSDDACKYSKTCPWKGEPPSENCVADPAVPCVIE